MMNRKFSSLILSLGLLLSTKADSSKGLSLFDCEDESVLTAAVSAVHRSFSYSENLEVCWFLELVDGNLVAMSAKREPARAVRWFLVRKGDHRVTPVEVPKGAYIPWKGWLARSNVLPVYRAGDEFLAVWDSRSNRFIPLPGGYDYDGECGDDVFLLKRKVGQAAETQYFKWLPRDGTLEPWEYRIVERSTRLDFMVAKSTDGVAYAFVKGLHRLPMSEGCRAVGISEDSRWLDRYAVELENGEKLSVFNPSFGRFFRIPKGCFFMSTRKEGLIALGPTGRYVPKEDPFQTGVVNRVTMDIDVGRILAGQCPRTLHVRLPNPTLSALDVTMGRDAATGLSCRLLQKCILPGEIGVFEVAIEPKLFAAESKNPASICVEGRGRGTFDYRINLYSGGNCPDADGWRWVW